MGKGEIVSGGTNGLYNVKLILHREHILLKIEDLITQIDIWTAKIAEMDEGSAKIAATFQKNILVKRKAYLENNMPEDPTIQAWCADYTDDLSGIVGTIETPGESGSVNIQPGYDGNATYDEDRDGQLQPSIASKSAAGTFYNLAMLPGWQKWMPTSRYGRILEIDYDNDTCTVQFDAIPSSQQNLNINYFDNLVGIPIEYMSCNSSIFLRGDHVVVQFTSINTQTTENWATAKVIGFADNPRCCQFGIKLMRDDDTLITEESGLLINIWAKNSLGEDVSTSEPIYNTETEEWEFQVIDGFDLDGYFIYYNCETGIETQYPYRYKTADKGQSDDLIKPHTGYEDNIPYWLVSADYTGSFAAIDGVLIKTTTVYSSIPYRLTHYLTGSSKRTPHIRYRLLDFYPDGLCGGGGRACTPKGYNEYHYIADINPIDSGDPDLTYYYSPPEYMFHGGFADSMLVLDFASSKLTFQEVWPIAGEIDEEEIEEWESGDIEGREHIFTATNNTPAGADPRTMVCACDYTGNFDLDYVNLNDDLVTFGFKNVEYDF